MWFESLVGFEEESPEQVRANIQVDGEFLTSLVNGRRMRCGTLETPSLAELRSRVKAINAGRGSLRLAEKIANVQDLHTDPSNEGAFFQVASQFNLLEMVGPSTTPEEGVGIYEYDHTQGPACAIACGAGTIYRNYFVDIYGITGQSRDNQIDCLEELGIELRNFDDRLWEMRNGYALASAAGLEKLAETLANADEQERDRLRGLLRIGIQSNTQVTLLDETASLCVTQAFCSALPVAYSRHPAEMWAEFARFVLEASYEATICAGILNAASTGNYRIFLTLLGGGAFGNRAEWIMDAIERAVNIFSDFDLDVSIVSYGASKPHVRELVNRFSQRSV